MPTKTSVYGQYFTVNDRYAEGHKITAEEAEVLNRAFASAIVNPIRAHFADLGFSTENKIPDGSTEAAQVAEMFKAELADFSWTKARTSRSTDPLGKEARRIARVLFEQNLAAHPDWDAVGKRDKSDADVPRVYPYELYVQKVAEIAKTKEVIKMAENNLKLAGGISL